MKKPVIETREMRLVERMAKLLEGKYHMNLTDELADIIAREREFNYYLPNDEEGLEEIFNGICGACLEEFASCIARSDYFWYATYIYVDLNSGQIEFVNHNDVYDDFIDFMTDEDYCTDELLDEVEEIVTKLESM
jgi:hypothetical protein